MYSTDVGYRNYVDRGHRVTAKPRHVIISINELKLLCSTKLICVLGK